MTRAHKSGDKEPSLTLDVAGDRIRFNCKRGCSQEEVIASLEARNLWPPDKEAAPPSTDPRRPKKLTKEWPYRTLAGKVLAWHGRFEFQDVRGGKEFLWRLDGQERWAGLGGLSIAELPLYNVDLLAEDPDAPVYITEGEKSADACVDHGLIAVSLGGGAAQKEFGTGLEALRGRKVILWPDRDDAGAALMARVLALIPSASLVTWTDGPEKGDAFDYFTAGGTLDHLDEMVLSPEPRVRMTDEDIVVEIPRPGGLIEVTFSSIHSPNPRDLFCNIDVRCELAGVRPDPFGAHVNLKSLSNAEAFRRQLDATFGKEHGWTAVLETATRLLLASWSNAAEAIDLDQVALDWTEAYDIEGMVPAKEMTILFAKGGTGKTYLALYMVACLLTGLRCLGRAVHKQEAVLFIDYEANAKVVRRRFDRIIRGMGIEYTGGFKYLYARGVPLTQQLTRIKAELKRTGATFIVIDSAGSACGGKPEDADAALLLFNAVQSLKVTAILISHVTKGGDEMMPFGSSYWHNMARATWFIKAAAGNLRGDRKVSVGAWNRKMSDDTEQVPFGIEIDFDGRQGPVTIEHGPLKAEHRPEKKLHDHIYDVLEANGTPMGVYELVIALQLNDVLEIGEEEDADKKFNAFTSTVRTTLNRFKAGNTKDVEPLFVSIGSGKDTLWTLLSTR